VWVLAQGAGFDGEALARSVCNWGLLAGEITGRARVGTKVPVGEGLVCLVDAERRNILTPVTSMFLHGGWSHILGNGVFLWVFGNNVEDSMGRLRFLIFYMLCGLGAAAAQVAVDPASPVPMIGASGAISGVLGAYLLLYPKVRVKVLFFWFIFIQVISFPAYMVLLWWIGWQVISGLPQLTSVRTPAAGVAFWAHIGGFVTGLLLVKVFENRSLVRERTQVRHRLYPGHP